MIFLSIEVELSIPAADGAGLIRCTAPQIFLLTLTWYLFSVPAVGQSANCSIRNANYLWKKKKKKKVSPIISHWKAMVIYLIRSTKEFLCLRTCAVTDHMVTTYLHL